MNFLKLKFILKESIKKFFFFAIFVLIINIFAFTYFQGFFRFRKTEKEPTTYSSEIVSEISLFPSFVESVSLEKEDKIARDREIIKPKIIKAVYLTSWSAGDPRKINYVISLAKNTEINAVVIDIKDYSGYIAYDSKVPGVVKYGAKIIKIPNIEKLLEKLHQENIYTIARIAVFQDPVLATARPDLAIYKKYGLSPFSSFLASISLWFDNLKLAWMDPASKEVWNYNIAIAKEAWGLGFDEINFDYVRFPSDGNLKNMGFPVWEENIPRHMVIKEFFREVRQQLKDVVISVDLFGLTTTNYDDLGVGQIIEDAYEYFDYVCPMVYPSHYAPGFIGYKNPAAYPYEVVKYSVEKAKERLNIYKESKRKEGKEIKVWLRPWLQDFNLGAVYTPQMVKKEIEAVKDALGNDYYGFMLWNPSNIYSQKALEQTKSKN